MFVAQQTSTTLIGQPIFESHCVSVDELALLLEFITAFVRRSSDLTSRIVTVSVTGTEKETKTPLFTM